MYCHQKTIVLRITFLNIYGSNYLKKISLHVIPILNPDGALNYTMTNFNGIDLNRDALVLSQPESILLNKMYHSINPHFCFNLHGQRTIFAAGNRNNTFRTRYMEYGCKSN